MLITMGAFIGVLALLIIAHEIGHFTTAKAFKVRVEEFGIGFPPRLIGMRRGETVYSLNAVPLGGFVKMAGEEDPKVVGSLAGKGKGTRILVLSAGSLTNAILPLLLFSIAFMVPHDVVSEPVVVKVVAPASPAATAGIEAGDTLLSVNDEPIQNTAQLRRSITLNLGNEIAIFVKHSDSTTEEVRLIPRWKPPAGQGAVGIEFDTEAVLSSRIIGRQRDAFWRAVPMAGREYVETFILFKNGILTTLIGAAPVQVTGPVGIAQITGEAAKAGLSPLLEFTAFLSINLALINIFPLPALDGGRIAFVVLEWIRRGKRISPKTEGLIHFIGFALLIAAMVAITYQDIIRIVEG